VLFGAHVSSSGGIDEAVGRAVALGCRSLQVFPQSPRVWKPAVHPDEDLARFRELAAEAGGLVAVCHAPYLINLAGTDELTVERSEAVLSQALRTGRGLGALAVIVHLGSHLGSGFDAGLERAIPVLERVLELAGDGTWLLLENTAGAGGTMGRTIPELAAIIDRCGGHPWLGVCLDSAHLYASGVDVGDVAAVDAMLDELDAAIGLDRLKALHINDSQTGLGSNRDRHANVGEGMIGERMSAFLGRPRLQDLPAVLETPGHDGKGVDAQCMRQVERLWRLGLGS
jgi:deoxyribonuclease IV